MTQARAGGHGGHDKRRVLCVTSNYPRWEGDSTTPFVQHLAQDLLALGWEVDVLAPHAPSAASREQLNGISVDRFHYLWPERLETVCYQGGALLNLQKNKLNYLKLPALVFFQWTAIVKRLLSGHYDLLHSHWILPQGFTGVLAARPFNLPHVVTVHGSDAFALKGELLSKFKAFSLMGADAVTVNSSATRQQVLAIAPELTALSLIPMGIALNQPNPDRVAQLRQQFRGDQGPLLIYVGRLVEQKGIGDLLRAVALLSQTLTDCRLLILGEGPWRDALVSLADRLGISQRVSFIGWVEPSDVPNYLAAADIFVGPSKQMPDGSTEAQGLSFIEAMQAGTPVIATDVGGIGDTVKHEETGLLVPQDDPGAIAGSVLRLLSEPQLADKLIFQAKQATKHYTREATAVQFAQLFDAMLHHKSHRS
ncbi:glycosyltransferase family 4 protein [Shewanella salipaludis]|uniref:Glycosyltransferase family 4 protein n=1 Tax=Shewanella salipaludis TaxID=2723052 RepID=A0A972JIC1_9GAMM|nr:glycosyltransferase family 4 protein [Shewanella salipaludis]NMH64853.1 glycosyltransferase family 4 protein [Shewanella salipaludis]